MSGAIHIVRSASREEIKARNTTSVADYTIDRYAGRLVRVLQKLGTPA